MEKTQLTRRAFSKAFAGSLLSGGILEAAVQESRTAGRLSNETALTLLEHIGYEPTLPNELDILKPQLESVIRDLETIRNFEVPMTLEPSMIFRADR